jgi:hypothetical protein
MRILVVGAGSTGRYFGGRGSIHQISITLRRFQRGGFSRASEIAESPKRQMSNF